MSQIHDLRKSMVIRYQGRLFAVLDYRLPDQSRDREGADQSHPRYGHFGSKSAILLRGTWTRRFCHGPVAALSGR